MDFMNRITGLVLALVIGAILVGGLLIPSIEAMTTTEKTFENEGYFNMTKLTADDSTVHTYVYIPGEDFITIDGEPFTIPNKSVSILMWDDGLIRSGVSSSTPFVQLITSTVPTLQGGDSFTASFASGTVTVEAVTSGVTTTKTSSYTEIYMIKNGGEFVMKNSDIPAYMHEGDLVYAASDLYAEGVTTAGGYWGNVFQIIGTINDVEITKIAGSSFTFTDTEIVKEKVNGYNGLYKLDKITFNAVGGTPETTTAVTYSYFLVPASVTAELSQHLDVTEIAMFGVISLLGIVMLIVVAANAIRNKY